MAKSLYAKMIAMVALAMVVSHVANAITCQDGIAALQPCITFVLGVGPAQPSPQCCAGVDSLNKLASTVEARRTLCQCLKAASSAGIDFARAKQLPSLCHVSVGFEISPDVDCSKIQ